MEFKSLPITLTEILIYQVLIIIQRRRRRKRRYGFFPQRIQSMDERKTKKYFKEEATYVEI